MAHYALLNKNNIVIQVFVGVDENELIEGKDPETWYGEFHNLKCLRTSYNTFGNKHANGGTPFRGNYAGIGYFYDQELDVFLEKKPYLSWKLDYKTFLWEPPIPIPEKEEGYKWRWSEYNHKWVKTARPFSDEWEN
jgi:hypothetical protein